MHQVLKVERDNLSQGAARSTPVCQRQPTGRPAGLWNRKHQHHDHQFKLGQVACLLQVQMSCCCRLALCSCAPDRSANGVLPTDQRPNCVEQCRGNSGRAHLQPFFGVASQRAIGVGWVFGDKKLLTDPKYA